MSKKTLNEDSLKEVSGGYRNKNAKFELYTMEKDGANIAPGEHLFNYSIGVSGSTGENEKIQK